MPRTPAGLHVPVSREERMRALDAVREKMEEGHDDPQAKALERELRTIDDRLRVVKISARAGELHPRLRGPGVIPGRWHMKLLTRPMNAYFPICGENWTYRDPELAIVEEMKKNDLWRRGALEEIYRGEEADERARIRAVLLDREQREDVAAENYRAAKRVAGDGGEFRRHDRKRSDEPGVRPYAGGVKMKTSDSGLVLPAGA